MSQSEIIISATKRIPQGRCMNKRLRKAGKIPCVLYGHGVEPVSLTVDLTQIIPAIDHPSIMTLTLEGKKKDSRKVLIKEVQHDYLNTNVTHVDFQQVRMDETISAEVPLEVAGHPIGLQHGGQLDQIMHSITVECLPSDLPDRVVFDVSHLDIGDNVAIEEIPLPDGVKAVYSDPHAVAIHVIRSRMADVEEATEEEKIESAAAEGPEVIEKGKKEEAE